MHPASGRTLRSAAGPAGGSVDLGVGPGTSEDDWPFGKSAGLRELFLDLSEAGHVATDTIAYVITDQNGLAATSRGW